MIFQSRASKRRDKQIQVWRCERQREWNRTVIQRAQRLAVRPFINPDVNRPLKVGFSKVYLG